MDTVMRRKKERGRLTVPGYRTGGGERCSHVVLHEAGGRWAPHPHGACRLFVRRETDEAVRVTEAILAGAR